MRLYSCSPWACNRRPLAKVSARVLNTHTHTHTHTTVQDVSFGTMERYRATRAKGLQTKTCEALEQLKTALTADTLAGLRFTRRRTCGQRGGLRFCAAAGWAERLHWSGRWGFLFTAATMLWYAVSHNHIQGPRRTLLQLFSGASFLKDIPLVEFMYFVFTRMPGDSHRRRLRSLLLYLC